jgi:BirA family biotin operon repressor/biotin-[acetyl-CoA-carboxylase] ligase
MHGDPSSDCQLIVGVGVNFALGSAAEDIDQASIDCAQLGLAHSDRPHLATTLLGRLVDYLQQFEKQGFAEFHQRWSGYDWLAGKPVRVMLRGESREGTAKSVADDGALLVDYKGELHRHIAGEVSVRRQ